MITKPTVLILGAGASVPYGFPSSKELFKEINSSTTADTLIKMGYTETEIKTFKVDLYRSGQTYVDAFLENRQDLMEIGKAAMACILIAKEKEEALFGLSIPDSDKWYNYLFRNLQESCENFGDNTVSIITYNYDRSLEHFLFNSLKNSYKKSDEECAEQLRKIPIIHLHGRLGYLPWQRTGVWVRDYCPNKDSRVIAKTAKGIKIISENIGIENDPDFAEAIKLLKSAERIYFLGFGYNKTNLRRLRLNEWASETKVVGSRFGFVNNELVTIREAFNDRIAFADQNIDVLQFLRNYVVWSEL